MILRRVPAGALLVTGMTACGGGGGDGPREPVPPGWEGEIELTRIVRHRPAAAPENYLFASARFEDDLETMWLDAGPEISLTGPAGDIVLERTDVLGRIVYQKESGTDIDPSLFVNGASYGLDVGGSSRDYGLPGFTLDDALTVPETFQLSSPDLSSGELVIAAAATSLSLTWTPSPADRVEIILAVASNGVATYRTHSVADDGGFDVPAESLAALPPGDGALTIRRVIDTPLVFPEEGEGIGIGGDGVDCLLVRE